MDSIERNTAITAMRETLDILEANPDLPIPSQFGMNEWDRLVFFPKDPTTAANLVKALGGKLEKNDPKTSAYDATFLVMKGVSSAGLFVDITVSREGICTKKVVGTEKKKVVKVVIPQQTEEVEEYVDVIEYECASLLSLADQEVMNELASHSS